MADYTRSVRNILREHGWSVDCNGKGDHVIWRNRDKTKSVSVDGAIISRHSANGGMKQAGIDHKFR